MTTNEWLIVCSTLLGPVLAVQAQKWVESFRERRRVRQHVFSTLMATRGARLSHDHVRALNMIDITFYGTVWFGIRRSSKADVNVRNAWKEYHDHLSDPRKTAAAQNADPSVIAESEDLLVKLLSAMGNAVGYSFDRVQIKKGWYNPIAHGESEMRSARLVNMATEVFAGERALKITAHQDADGNRARGD